MSDRREIRFLNRLLRQELGENPWLHAWQHTRSNELKHPYPARDTSGKEKVDWVCQCGRDVRVHAPNCSGLTIPIRVLKWDWRLPAYPDSWVLCRRHNVNRMDFVATFKSDEHFRPQVWSPLDVDDFPPPGHIMRHGRLPSLDDTQLVIRMVRGFNSKTPKEWQAEFERRDDEAEAESLDQMTQAIEEGLGIRPWAGHPGFCKTGVSYATPEKEQFKGVNS